MLASSRASHVPLVESGSASAASRKSNSCSLSPAAAYAVRNSCSPTPSGLTRYPSPARRHSSLDRGAGVSKLELAVLSRHLGQFADRHSVATRCTKLEPLQCLGAVTVLARKHAEGGGGHDVTAFCSDAQPLLRFAEVFV